MSYITCPICKTNLKNFQKYLQVQFVLHSNGSCVVLEQSNSHRKYYQQLTVECLLSTPFYGSNCNWLHCEQFIKCKGYHLKPKTATFASQIGFLSHTHNTAKHSFLLLLVGLGSQKAVKNIDKDSNLIICLFAQRKAVGAGIRGGNKFGNIVIGVRTFVVSKIQMDKANATSDIYWRKAAQTRFIIPRSTPKWWVLSNEEYWITTGMWYV